MSHSTAYKPPIINDIWVDVVFFISPTARWPFHREKVVDSRSTGVS